MEMLIPELAATPTVGRVSLANEGAFAASFMSQPLTDYAVGWKTQDGKLEELLEFLAPGVQVARRFEYRRANNADDFALVENVERPLYGDFMTVKSMGDIVQAKTVNKGLTTVIEKDSELPGERERKVAWLKKLLLRADIKTAYGLLNTAATNTAKTWNTSATPDADIADKITAFGDAVGIDANRVVIGMTAWAKRRGAFSGKQTADAMANYGFTPDMLGQWLGADVLLSKERVTSGSGKSALATANQVIVFAGEQGANIEDASSVKRFWTPEEGGGEWLVFVDDQTNPKLVKITVCHTDVLATTISTGVQKLTIS